MIKLKEILLEDISFSNWKIPSDSDLEREFRVEHDMKDLNYFETPNEFIRAVKKAKKVKITRSVDNEIYGRSQTTSYEELLSLIKNYRSYPKYRNQKTLKAIYDGFKKGRPMDMPIVLKDKHGDMKIFSGNTRMDISFQLGINPTVIILEVDEI